MIEEGNPMSDTPEEERILKIAAFGFDRPEEAPLDDFPCCSDTELHWCNSEAAQSDRDNLARTVGGVLFNVRNFPEAAQVRLLGQDMRPLNDKLTDAILSAGWRPPVPADHRTEPSRWVQVEESQAVLDIPTRDEAAEPVRVEPTTDDEGNRS